MLEALTAALATTAGKAAAGLAIASASVGGLAAADVVELPPQAQDQPADVTTEDQAETPVLPDEAQTGQDAAELGADNAEDTRQEGEGDLENEAADPDANDFGQEVADLAQDPESTGEDVSTFARENNPGAAHSADAGAPEDAGERQDETVRQDDGAPQGADAAGEHIPEQAGEPGSQGDENRGGAAAAGARP